MTFVLKQGHLWGEVWALLPWLGEKVSKRGEREEKGRLAWTIEKSM